MHLLSFFRAVALIEGVTTLALFFVAMPLKYLADMPFLIAPVGWSHGIAFLLYVALAAAVLPLFKAPPSGYFRTFLAALFPFGTFLNDGFILRLGKGVDGVD